MWGGCCMPAGVPEVTAGRHRHLLGTDDADNGAAAPRMHGDASGHAHAAPHQNQHQHHHHAGGHLQWSWQQHAHQGGPAAAGDDEFNHGDDDSSTDAASVIRDQSEGAGGRQSVQSASRRRLRQLRPVDQGDPGPGEVPQGGAMGVPLLHRCASTRHSCCMPGS